MRRRKRDGKPALIAPEIDREAVLRADPEAIIASGPDVWLPAWLDDWRAFPGLAAVAAGHLYAIRADVMQQPDPAKCSTARRRFAGCSTPRGPSGRTRPYQETHAKPGLFLDAA